MKHNQITKVASVIGIAEGVEAAKGISSFGTKLLSATLSLTLIPPSILGLLLGYAGAGATSPSKDELKRIQKEILYTALQKNVQDAMRDIEIMLEQNPELTKKKKRKEIRL